MILNKRSWFPNFAEKGNLILFIKTKEKFHDLNEKWNFPCTMSF